MGEATLQEGEAAAGARGRVAWKWLGRASWSSALLLAPTLALLPLVWRLATHAAAVLTYPWQIDYDEGIILRAAWIVAQGQNPYHPLRPDAFTSATYPPLFYILNALWLRLSGPTLLSGRLMALAAALAIAGLLAWWAWRESRSRLAGGLTAALWLSLSPVYVWSTFFKPDLPALGLTLAGLAVARGRPVGPALALSAPIFALAFFTKQSALVGPLAVGLWLLAGRGPWLRFGLATGGLIAGLVALGTLLTRGGLWTHMVTFQQIPWTIGQLTHNLGKLWETYPWLLAAGALALLWLVAGRPIPHRARPESLAEARGATPASPLRRRPMTPLTGTALDADHAPITLTRSELAPRWPFGLPVWYLAAAVPAVLIANGRAGVNYGLLLDLFPPLCLVVGVAAGALLGAPGRLWPALGALLSGLVLVQAVVPNPPSAWYTANRMPSPERARRMQNIAGIVEQTQGRILSEDLWLLLRAGKPIEYDDPFMMAQTARRGIWDERRFVADLEAQRFALVLLEYEITDIGRSPRWSSAALAALRANYEILHRDVVHVHRPKSLLRAPGTRQEIVYGGQIRLLETATSTAATRPGGTVRVMVRWGRAAPPTADYKLFIHLLDPAGGMRAQVDVPPGVKPTRAWGANERAEAEYALTLPEDAPPGAYQVVVGLYDPATGARLPAAPAGAPGNDAVPIAELRVGEE